MILAEKKEKKSDPPAKTSHHFSLFTAGKTNISLSYLPVGASVLLSWRFRIDKRKLSLQIGGIELERNGHLPENDGTGCSGLDL